LGKVTCVKEKRKRLFLFFSFSFLAETCNRIANLISFDCTFVSLFPFSIFYCVHSY
jgi:hypothetical protein